MRKLFSFLRPKPMDLRKHSVYGGTISSMSGKNTALPVLEQGGEELEKYLSKDSYVGKSRKRNL